MKENQITIVFYIASHIPNITKTHNSEDILKIIYGNNGIYHESYKPPPYPHSLTSTLVKSMTVAVTYAKLL